jgi:hypothetical protein
VFNLKRLSFHPSIVGQDGNSLKPPLWRADPGKDTLTSTRLHIRNHAGVQP